MDALPKKLGLSILFVIFATGAFLRFEGLPSRGLVEWDEAHYMMEAKFVRSVFDHLPDFLQKMREGKMGQIEKTIEGWPIVSAKPGHAFTIFLASLAIGMKDFAGSLVSALLGLATVLLVYRLGTRFAGEVAGLAGAAALAVSGYHVMYSRSPLAEADAAFFFLFGFVLLERTLSERQATWRLPAAGGLLLGYALASNYRWFFVAGPLLIACFLWSPFFNSRKDWQMSWKKLSFFSAFVFVPLISFQVPYWTARLAGVVPQQLLAGGYWESLRWYFTTKPGQGSFSPHLLFVRSLASLEGAVVTILIILGTITALRRLRETTSLLLLLPALLPLVAFSLTSRGDRLVAVSLVAPFLALLAGVGASRLVSLFPEKRRRLGLYALLALILAFGAWNASWNLGVRSGWKEVAQFANDRQGKVLSFEAPILKFYLGREFAILPPSSREKLTLKFDEGYRYLALDWKKYHAANYSSIIREIESQCHPIFESSNRVLQFPIFVDNFHYPHLDSHIPQDRHLFSRIANDPSSWTIRVYDVAEFLNGNCVTAVTSNLKEVTPSL